MRLCSFQPTFVAAIEHSDADLQALLDELAQTCPVAASLSAAQFHVNTSKQPRRMEEEQQYENRSLRSVDYAALFDEVAQKGVADKYAVDFQAFGYSTDVACA